jgi:hypothetical protein
MRARQRLWPLALAVTLCTLVASPAGGRPAAHGVLPATGRTRAGEWRETATEFGRGVSERMQVGDEGLALAPGAAVGSYTSAPYASDFTFNAVGLRWQAPIPCLTGNVSGQADVPAEASLRVLVRASGDDRLSQPTAALTTGCDNLSDGHDWSPWQDVPELEDGRAARDADWTWGDLVVLGGRWLQYRLELVASSTAEAPLVRAVTLVYIDSSAGPSTAQAVASARVSADGPVPRPAIIPRAGWGADESLRFDPDGNELWPPEYATARKIIVHHTVTVPNASTPYDPNPAATVRAVYYYHAVTNGWGDVGYNFLVDQYGHIYEGRFGGDDEASSRLTSRNGGRDDASDVVGGHAFCYNRGSVGLAALGSYGNTPQAIVPSAALLEGLRQVSTWKAY